MEGSAELEVMQHHDSNINAGFGRSAGRQAEFQIAALFMTLAVAIVGGILTGDTVIPIFIYILFIFLIYSGLDKGFIMRLPCLGRVEGENLFDDKLSWEMEHQQEQDHKNKGILEDNNDIEETGHML